MAAIRRFARTAGEPFGAAIRRVDLMAPRGGDEMGLPKAAAAGLASFVDVLDEARRMAETGVGPGELLTAIVEAIGFYDHLAKLGDDVAESQIEATETLIELAGRQASIEAFLEQASLSSETDEVDEADGRVLIMTVHAAKGLEFPVVFVPALEEGVFPGLRLSTPEEAGALDAAQRAEVEEERRLAYVAITRAKERLVLSWATDRRRYGSSEQHKPSRFLAELPARVRAGVGE